MEELKRWSKNFVDAVTQTLTLLVLVLAIDQALGSVSSYEPVFKISIERRH